MVFWSGSFYWNVSSVLEDILPGLLSCSSNLSIFGFPYWMLMNKREKNHTYVHLSVFLSVSLVQIKLKEAFSYQVCHLIFFCWCLSAFFIFCSFIFLFFHFNILYRIKAFTICALYHGGWESQHVGRPLLSMSTPSWFINVSIIAEWLNPENKLRINILFSCLQTVN